MQCHDCKSTAKLKECEMHNPKNVKICKDCCYIKMNGHRCRWWELCHGM